MKTAAEILQAVGLPLPQNGESRYYAICPICSLKRKREHQKSKVVGVTITDKGVRWCCNHCGWKGGKLFNGKDHDFIVATYEYTDEGGKVLSRKVRTAKKNFWQQRPDDNGGWINDTKNVRRVLYRLPEVIEAVATQRTVLIVEGEKDVETLRTVNLPATCNFNGAAEPNKRPKWRQEYSEALRGADIVIIPDHDPPGYAHADAIAAMSLGVAESVRILKLAEHWRDCPVGGDISDWFAAGHTREELDALIANIPHSQNSKSQQATVAAPPRYAPVKVYWDEQDDEPETGMLVKNILPARGLSLLIAQSGFFKSYSVLDLQMACLLKTEFMGQQVERQGGVIYFAAEAPDTIQRRWRALKKAKALQHFEKLGQPMPRVLPFARIKAVPLLKAEDALDRMLTICEQARQEMKQYSDFDLVQVSVDTLMAASLFKKENESGEVSAVLYMLEKLALAINANVLAVDHMGKDPDRGARGTSAKLAPVYSELSIYGEKNPKTGVVNGTYMVLTKNRTGAAGLKAAFHPVEITLGTDEHGNLVSDLVLQWDGGLVPDTKLAKNNKRHRILMQAFDDIVSVHGRRLLPEPDWPEVIAVPATALRERFIATYPNDGGPDHGRPTPVHEGTADSPSVSAKKPNTTHEDTAAHKYRDALKDACGQRVLMSYTLKNGDAFIWKIKTDSTDTSKNR